MLVSLEYVYIIGGVGLALGCIFGYCLKSCCCL